MLFMVYPQMIPNKGQSAGEGGRLGMPGSAFGVGAAGTPGRSPVGEGSPAAVGSVSTAAAAMKAEKFEPRMYGFRVHEEARLSRWRLAQRDA
jgi:casein kinase II subunit beta